MKIKEKGAEWLNAPKEFNSVAEAIRWQLEPDGYMYQDQIGKLQRRAELHQELIINLIEALILNNEIGLQSLEHILSDKYEVS